MKKQKKLQKQKVKASDPHYNPLPGCYGCNQDCDNCQRMYPKCARCDCEAFILGYDPDEKILYGDCANCGFRVLRFKGEPYYEEPTLKDMPVKGEC